MPDASKLSKKLRKLRKKLREDANADDNDKEWQKCACGCADAAAHQEKLAARRITDKAKREKAKAT